MTDDRPYQLEGLIGWVLRIGVIVSSAIVVLGLCLLLAIGPGGDTVPDRGAALASALAPDSAGGTGYPTDLGGTIRGVAEGRPGAIIALGLLLLIATPMTRVAVTVVSFALRRDFVFLGLTGFVLVMLLVGFLLNRGGE